MKNTKNLYNGIKLNIKTKYNLDRFILAQEKDYKIAKEELKNGVKKNHYMWYMFPQLKSLGKSTLSKLYGIENFDEAKYYLENSVLKKRLEELCNILLQLNQTDPKIIFSYPDNLKFHACLTLFYFASNKNILYKNLLIKYFNEEYDKLTIRALKDDSFFIDDYKDEINLLNSYTSSEDIDNNINDNYTFRGKKRNKKSQKTECFICGI